jgi:hypothetical protein
MNIEEIREKAVAICEALSLHSTDELTITFPFKKWETEQNKIFTVSGNGNEFKVYLESDFFISVSKTHGVAVNDDLTDCLFHIRNKSREPSHETPEGEKALISLWTKYQEFIGK